VTDDYHANDAAIEAFFADPEGPIGKIMEQFAIKVETAAKALVLIPGSGRIYTTTFWRDSKGRLRRGHARPAHQASSPGEPPASDTGNLLNHITHEVLVEKTVFARVKATVKYAEYLELGTRYMAPRPFLRPALDIGLKGTK
jgi:HK97 gp10 family phage protein